MKSKKLLSTFIGVATFALTVSGCSFLNRGNRSKSGSDQSQTTSDVEDDERYQIYLLAKEAGYEGTYEEWLKSIRGEDGASLLTGHGAPDPSLGKDGDTYIDLDSWDFYLKRFGSWYQQGNIKGDDGQDGQDGKDGKDGQDGADGTSLYSGEGQPSSELGKDGDKYIDTTTWDCYIKENGQWIGIGNIKGEDGQSGADGTSILTGQGEPDVNLGKDGDSYVDLSTWDYYVKVDGVWSLVGNIKGEDYVRETHTVSFDSRGGSPVESQEVLHGEKAVKPDDPIRSGYTLNYWEYLGEPWVFHGYVVTEDMELTANWKQNGEYIVQFVNDDGSLLYETTADYGESVTYPYASPEAQLKEAHYRYTFNGWDQELVVTGNMVFRATYVRAYVATTVYYQDYDGTLLATVQLAEGEQAVYPGTTPTREDDNVNQLQFLFVGWDLTDEDSESMTYTARYASCTKGLDIIDGAIDYYHGTVTDVIIPEYWDGQTITKINYNAFGSTAITSVTIPSSITIIYGSAFSNCQSLTTVNLSEGLLTIGSSAFSGCSALRSISIPNTVTSLGSSAFYYCSALKEISLGNGIQIIYGECFRYCSSLTSIVIPDSVTYIDNLAFENCSSLASVSFGSNLQTIGYCAFRYCRALTSITLPDSVTSISNQAFYSCNSLASVTLSNNLQTIGYEAFRVCSALKTIVIPATVTMINDYAFADTGNLIIFCEHEYKPKDWSTTWNYGNNPVVWNYSGNGQVITNNSLKYLDGTNDVYIMEILGEGTDISIPATINNKNVHVSTRAINNAYCMVNKTIEHFSVEEGVTLFGNDRFTFNGCASLVSANIPASFGFTSIDNFMFKGCARLTSVSLNNNLQTIGSYVFANCTSLTSITIPSTVTSIGDFVFAGDSSLEEIIYLGTIAQWESIQKGDYWCANINVTTVSCSDGHVDFSPISLPYMISLITEYDNYAWTESDGVYTSSNQGMHDTTSSMQIVFNAAGTFSFDYLSCGEGGCDYLIVYKNGAELFNRRYSASNNFYSYELTVQAGDVLRFTFRKDGSSNYDLDCAKIRNLVFTAA